MGYKHLKFPENSLFLVTGAAGLLVAIFVKQF